MPRGPGYLLALLLLAAAHYGLVVGGSMAIMILADISWEWLIYPLAPITFTCYFLADTNPPFHLYVTLPLDSLLYALFYLWLIRRVLARRRARAEAAKGSCPACGYDLRGSPAVPGAGATCPECGAAAPTA